MTVRRLRAAFTLIELLVVIAIIGLVISILVPALNSARTRARGTVCATRLRTMGQGLLLYANDNKDTLVPGRLPKIDEDDWRFRVRGGVKYRPTFLTMMESQVGLPPFEEPLPNKNFIDRFGQPGDRQNYSNDQYLCPEVREWADERNGAFGYNYQFLGNARLLDSDNLLSYKNWPVKSSAVRSPASCVAVADSIGTAAAFPLHQRRPYEDNDIGDSKSGRSPNALGNEGFNLDPPRIDVEDGEMADDNDGKPTPSAVHERHAGKANVLWVDGHGTSETYESLGYELDDDGAVTQEGNNRFFSIHGRDEPWLAP